VRSIVGRFLEHTRVFHFHNDGNLDTYLSSADWMDRNFFNRIETCFLIEDKRLRDRIIKKGLNSYLSDNVRAWQLRSDGTYTQTKPGTSRPREAQQSLLEHLAN
jgi:polyphosphate kinase